MKEYVLNDPNSIIQYMRDKEKEIKQLKETDEYIIKTLESKVEKLQEDLRNKRISIKNKKAEIKTLGERCNQLLKDKGDLTDKCREFEQQIEKNEKVQNL